MTAPGSRYAKIQLDRRRRIQEWNCSSRRFQ
jgi:hypothetical protein